MEWRFADAADAPLYALSPRRACTVGWLHAFHVSCTVVGFLAKGEF